MERSRTKRHYYDQDYESETLHLRNKSRYSNYSNGGGGGGGGHHYTSHYHRRLSSEGYGGGRRMVDPPLTVTTSYRILCHDLKISSVIGKSGSIIKSIKQHTGASVSVHDLFAGDEERIVEITDIRQRDPDGRITSFSPAQEALLLVHDRILESEVSDLGVIENREYGVRGGGGGGGNRMATRLVVSKMHVGCLMGKGGKIIEQMRMETRTHIRILPGDHMLPRCIGPSDEIVQVVGNMNDLKHALEIISSRLRESQHRDRGHFSNMQNFPDHFGPIDDDFHRNSRSRRSSGEEPEFRSRNSCDSKRNSHSSHSGHVFESESLPVNDNAQYFPGEDIVFRILCPIEKVDCVVGESGGIVELLRSEIGVNVDITDPVTGTDEHLIIISSDEGLDDELFPAQEALLHIQSRIVDLVPEKENIITTRLLLQSDEVGCIGSNDATLEMGNFGGAKVKILPTEELPLGISRTDKIVQIIGEIKAARNALIEVTSRIRSYVHREFLKNDVQACRPLPIDGRAEPEALVNNNSTSNPEPRSGNESVNSAHQNAPTEAATEKIKNETGQLEDQPSTLNRISMPLITRSTLEVVIPPHAASLATKSRKLTLISDISGAAVTLIEEKEKTIQISGTPEQVERAQSLLQGLILSAEEDEK